MSGNLERRYRRVLRLLPGWYRDKWEEDMVAAFLDSWLTGDPDADAYITRVAGPGWAETASVASLGARLHLVGAGTSRRFAWGQAIRRAVLAVTLIQAARGLDILVRTAWGRGLFGWLPAPPANIVSGTPVSVLPPVAWYLVAYAWIVVFVLLVLRHYRTAQVVAALAIVPDLVSVLQGQITGRLPAPSIGPAWAFWILINLAPVLAMTAFRRHAPPAVRWPWLLALPAAYLLVYVPLLALQATGNSAWLPDFSGLYCLLVALACLTHALTARSRPSARSGVRSLTLTLLAADAGAYRIASIANYWHDPHLIAVSLAELLILAAAAALVAPEAARAQTATPAPPSVSAPVSNPMVLPRRTLDMSLPPLRPSLVLAGVLAAAGILLTAAGCSQVTPLAPKPAATPAPPHAVGAPVFLPPPRQLGSPIILQVMRSEAAAPSGGCPAGSVAVSVPPGAAPAGCYRPVGTPVTITSAAVSVVSPQPQPAPPPDQTVGPAQYGFTVAVPAADMAAVRALATQAYDSRDAIGISAAGQLWKAPQLRSLPEGAPASAGSGLGQQFQIAFPTKNQALQLYRILIPPS